MFNRIYVFGVICATLAASSGFAASFEVSDDINALCSGFEQPSADRLVCKNAKDFAKVNAAKVGNNYSGTDREVIAENDADPVAVLGVTGDDGSNTIYVYLRELLAKDTGKKIGYIMIEGIVNDEAGTKAQVTKRFNLDGRLVSAFVKDLF